jgi:cation-transporting P-type ATPase C
MKDHHVDCEIGREQEQRMLDKGHSVLFVAYGDEAIGLIGVEDRLKETATEVLLALKACGIEHISMLTGDREQHVKPLEQILPIDEIRWQQSPEDKAAWIRKWREQHPDKFVAMVGDGVNDGPALAYAYLTMGDNGADATVEHSDIVLQRGDLGLVVHTISLGQRTIKVIKQNYGISIGLNLAGVGLAALGLLSPLAGALSHNLVTAAVVANSMKLLSYQPDLSTLAGQVKPSGVDAAKSR